MLVLQDRVLFAGGTTLVDDDAACRHAITHGSLAGVLVEPSEDARLYQLYYGEKIAIDLRQVDELDKIDHGHPPAGGGIILLPLERRDDTPSELHEARISAEMEFYERHGCLPLLNSLVGLVGKFREQGIPWCGRGSSCASYVLYLIGVHDTNPILHDIPFSEFSKEQ